MDRQKDRQIDIHMERQMNRQMDRQMDKRMDWQMDFQMDRQTDGQTYGQINELADGQTVLACLNLQRELSFTDKQTIGLTLIVEITTLILPTIHIKFLVIARCCGLWGTEVPAGALQLPIFSHTSENVFLIKIFTFHS